MTLDPNSLIGDDGFIDPMSLLPLLNADFNTDKANSQYMWAWDDERRLYVPLHGSHFREQELRVVLRVQRWPDYCMTGSMWYHRPTLVRFAEVYGLTLVF